MKSIFFEQSESRCSSALPVVLALSAMLAAPACVWTDHDKSQSEKVDVALAALMSDGPLPVTMTSGPMPAPPPFRFCGGGGSDQDGGVSGPPTGGAGRGGVVVLPPSVGVGGPVMVGPVGGGAAGGISMGGGAGVGPMGSADGGVAGSGGGGIGGQSDGGMSGQAGGGTAGKAGGGTGGQGGGGMSGQAGSGSGGNGGGGMGGQGGGMDPSCAGLPIGFWNFDDCNTERTDLQDSSFQGHSAFRNVDLTCTDGQEGQAVTFANAGDIVYAPDQPDFGLDAGVTVAAWVKPDKVDGVRTIFRKRDDANSAFALIINAKKFQFVIRLASGKLATVSATAKAGEWTHVAATYDGTYLRLYLNGKKTSETKAAGMIAKGVGPLLMGNDIAGRKFQGLMDNAWFNTLAAPDATILELTCLHHPPTLSVSPQVGPTVEAGTAVTYQLSITNNNGPTCPPVFFQSEPFSPPGFTSTPFFGSTDQVQTGETANLSFDIASGEDTDPGTYSINFFVIQNNDFGTISQTQADYVVGEPSGCHVSSGRELTIRDVSVVDDPARTSLDGPASDPSTGAWTFGRMMERLSPNAAAAPDVTEAMFRTFLSTQTINGFTVAPRPPMDPLVLQPWPRSQDGKLDLARAPMRLLAIVNRLDLKDLAKGKAGEGRMVYGVLDQNGFSMEFTVILEYLLPATDETEFRAWADAFHALQALPFPSADYNAALQAITDRFSARDAIPSNPNGTALIDIRTNEIALSDGKIWQLREFHVSPTTGFMDPATLFLTPDLSFNGSNTLARFINANEATIVTETHEVPATFENAPFQAGAVFNDFFTVWSAPGIDNPEARHKLALNTCNGCHGVETNTGFLQINPRNQGETSFLSSFLTGETVSDPVTGQPRRMAELARRRQLLESVVCASPAQP